MGIWWKLYYGCIEEVLDNNGMRNIMNCKSVDLPMYNKWVDLKAEVSVDETIVKEDKDENVQVNYPGNSLTGQKMFM